VVERGGVLAGELDSDVGGETEGEAEVETVRELGEPPVAVHPDTINATAPSTTPAARMPHILPAGPERGPRRAPDARNTTLGFRAWTDEDCRGSVRLTGTRRGCR
jgi:hypothetical protein